MQVRRLKWTSHRRRDFALPQAKVEHESEREYGDSAVGVARVTAVSCPGVGRRGFCTSHEKECETRRLDQGHFRFQLSDISALLGNCEQQL